MIYIVGTLTDDSTLPLVLYDNILTRGTVSWSSAVSGYPGSNVVNESTFDYWAPNSIPDYLSVDMGTGTDVNSVAIVAHTLGSSGASVNIDWSTDTISWTTVKNVVPTDDTPILVLFNTLNKRYWRVRIVSSSTSPVIGNIIMGTRLVLPGGVMPPYTPIWQAQKIDLLQSKSLGGQFLGNRILRKGAETSISLVSFSRTFSESTLQPFKSWYDAGHAFIWASSPYNFANDVGYVWRKPGAEMRPTFAETGNWVKITMEVEGYVQ